MKKFLDLVIALAMTLSLAACGGGDTPESEPAAPSESTPVESSASESTPAQTDGPLNALPLYAVPEGLSGTGWDFVGGCVNGAEMEQTDIDAALEQYGGMLGIVFDDETGISMVQGAGTLTGTYTAKEDTGLKIEFDNGGEALRYIGVFTEMDGTPVLVLMPDTTGMNGIYFTQVSGS